VEAQRVDVQRRRRRRWWEPRQRRPAVVVGALGGDVRRRRRVPQTVTSGDGRSGHERERERKDECDVWVGGARRRRAAVGVKSPNFRWPPTSRWKLP
jgi:hypothetical protein